MTDAITVSRHAKARARSRIGLVNPHALRALWEKGRPADHLDMAVFGAARRRDHHYRVVECEGQAYLFVLHARHNLLVTVLLLQEQ